MQKHVENYMDYFGYGIDDYIPSELSGLPCVDIHHIIKRSQGGSDDPETNLIGLTRKEHEKAEASIYSKEYLLRKHKEFIKSRNICK